MSNAGPLVQCPHRMCQFENPADAAHCARCGVPLNVDARGAAPQSGATLAQREGEIPPLPEDATAEQKELHWLRHVYQGDHVPQFTFRAVLMGGFIGMLMSISNLYTTLQVGWSFGVAITACVVSFTLWKALTALFGLFGVRLSPMSILENNCMQSTASAAGYSTGATLGTSVGALLIVTGEHLSWVRLAPFIFFTAALGVFIAIPMKRQMINVEQLPFPTGMAAAETLRSLYTTGAAAMHKAYALLLSMAFGAVIALLKFSEGMLNWLDWARTRAHMHLPELIPFPSLWTGIPDFVPPASATATATANAPASAPNLYRLAGFGFEPSVLLIGAGMLVGMRVALSMLGGAVLLYYGLAPWLLATNDAAAATGAPNFADIGALTGTFRPWRWALWGGTSLMVFSSLTSLALQWRTFVRAFRTYKRADTADADALASIEVPTLWLVAGTIPLGIGCVWVQWFSFNIAPWLGTIAVLMTAVIALVCCRATGETDTTPVGPMGKVTQLMYALLAQGNITTNLMTAGTTSAVGMGAADLLTDLKSGYLLGANPRKQFLAQFVGVFFGTLAVVPAWYLMVPNKERIEQFALPATNMWVAVAHLLTKGLNSIPVTAQYAAVIGAMLGILLPMVAHLAPRAAKFLPSAMGLGFAWIMPFQNALAFAIGAIIVALWSAARKASCEKYTVPIASGFIAGESLVLAMLAIMASAKGLLGW